jgi:DNA-3-methyladenine glycosylase
MTNRKLPREFYTRANVLTVARQLLGQLLVVPAPDGTRVSGIIVETEAYRGPRDRASHAWAGRRTRRTETMYQIGGTAYVYFVYGMYHQFNVVTNVTDIPHAVLIRALEPAEGISLMRRRRRGVSDPGLTSGPGKLCLALGIDRGLDRADLRGDRVWIERGARPIPPSEIASGPRIGIAYAQAWAAKPWRFWIKKNPFASGPAGPSRKRRAAPPSLTTRTTGAQQRGAARQRPSRSITGRRSRARTRSS